MGYPKSNRHRNQRTERSEEEESGLDLCQRKGLTTQDIQSAPVIAMTAYQVLAASETF